MAWDDRGPVEVTVPSDNICLVRKSSMSAFTKLGWVPNSLIPIVKDLLLGDKPTAVKDWDDEQVIDMVRLIDIVAVHCVVKPEVWPEPKCGTCGGTGGDGNCLDCHGSGEGTRQNDRLYVDQIDEDDKLFIYMFVTGAVKDVESFRAAAKTDVEDLSDSENVADETEHDVGDEG